MEPKPEIIQLKMERGEPEYPMEDGSGMDRYRFTPPTTTTVSVEIRFFSEDQAIQFVRGLKAVMDSQHVTGKTTVSAR
jgi:hypothetical protein